MENEISFNVGPAPRAEVPEAGGARERLGKGKISFCFLISIAMWTIFCVLGTWVFIYKHHFFFMERAIFLTYAYTFWWALWIWLVPATALALLGLIFSK